MIGDCVVYYDELTRGPAIGTLVFCHVIRYVSEHIVWKWSIITENNCELWVIPRINPAGIRSNNLIEEGLVAI